MSEIDQKHTFNDFEILDLEIFPNKKEEVFPEKYREEFQIVREKKTYQSFLMKTVFFPIEIIIICFFKGRKGKIPIRKFKRRNAEILKKT